MTICCSERAVRCAGVTKDELDVVSLPLEFAKKARNKPPTH